MLVESWTPEQDQRLLEMKAAGAQVALIANRVCFLSGHAADPARETRMTMRPEGANYQ